MFMFIPKRSEKKLKSKKKYWLEHQFRFNLKIMNMWLHHFRDRKQPKFYKEKYKNSKILTKKILSYREKYLQMVSKMRNWVYSKIRIRKRRSLIQEYLSKPDIGPDIFIDTKKIMRKLKNLDEGNTPVPQVFNKKEKIIFIFERNIELNDSIFQYYLKDYY